ncbi:DUF1156 domain-containing protein [Aliiruegeria sabulilitoris]|uniref:DUF1156 domain-containing protein n=1 Tax=Aliiruegeria sabulilitoris TaxID=1510458 RepID=UPI00082C4A8E|nr:DUF1156 domain-containing protein [Aliiruegeria sabulilitoris]NDR55353.1 DUF1156 domain-containing protein [Pseudoruegeria sp. M32A2M]
MTTTYKKKLIEVAIPLEAINAASAREKSIRHGHPSTLHLWWARRPLAACRAVLFAQLVDDPSSLPDEFPTPEAQDAERKRLFAIIEDLVKWENSTNEEVLERARAEIRRSCGGKLPPVYDPFSGGGSIPLEAQRLGLPAYGSDLNPVAVMIGKAMIEIPPKFKDMEPIHPGIKERQFYRNAEGLAEDVKHYGAWMREKAIERIGHLYPKVDLPSEYGGGKATVIAWIWARTVPSPDPAFSDVQVPIASSFLLSSKKGRETWIEPLVDKAAKTISYRIKHGGTKEALAKAKDGTKSGRGANFRCLLSDSAITPKHITSSGMRGAMGQTLIAIVASGPRGRVFVEPNEHHANAAFAERPEWKPELKQAKNPRWFSPPAYGMETFGDLFTDRQLITLTALGDLLIDAQKHAQADAEKTFQTEDSKPLNNGGVGAKAYSEAIAVYLAFALSRMTNTFTQVARWTPVREQTLTAFSRQAVPMTWDFPEVNPFAKAAGDYAVSVEGVLKGILGLGVGPEGSIIQAAAQSASFPEDAVLSTDPPYYDNIGYADLSDFFFVWLKLGLKDYFPNLFGLIATPKSEELVATPYRHGGTEKAESFFLQGMIEALKNASSQTSPRFPATIYYAFKQSEMEQEGIASTGWATFLQAVVEAGYAVVGTWPVRTERSARLVAKGNNALANSVVLVCRNRSIEAETITRAEFIRALKRELPPAIAELQAANVSPADMPQSAIGPGMGVFSRYQGVLESDDSLMSVKAALQLINAELDEYLGGIQGEFDPDTRFAISWFEQNGMGKGDYGVADNLARARGIAVESVKHAGIVESQAGKVRILKRDELDPEWEPQTDTHLTVWECLQYLVRAHEKDGISYNTALLLRKIDDKAEAVKDLAYCLYDICANKRQDAKQATAYNALIADWSDLTREAAAIVDIRGTGQTRMDF